MYHFKKSFLIVLFVSLFCALSIGFYRYTVLKKKELKKALFALSSYQSRIQSVKQKLSIIKQDESVVKNINQNLKTNFKINLTESSLKSLIYNIDAIYGSGLVVVKNAKIQSGNDTLNCTIEGFRWGL